MLRRFVALTIALMLALAPVLNVGAMAAPRAAMSDCPMGEGVSAASTEADRSGGAINEVPASDDMMDCRALAGCPVKCFTHSPALIERALQLSLHETATETAGHDDVFAAITVRPHPRPPRV